MDCSDCLPLGFKSSPNSPRATVLLQMLIVFSFCLSPGFLSSPLFLSVYTINLVHSHSHGLAGGERFEGGIWTYLTEGHPSLSSPTSPSPHHRHHHQKPHSKVVAPSSNLLCFIVALHNYIPASPLVQRDAETQGKQAK